MVDAEMIIAPALVPFFVPLNRVCNSCNLLLDIKQLVPRAISGDSRAGLGEGGLGQEDVGLREAPADPGRPVSISCCFSRRSGVLCA